jgi:hypothetical protein
MTLKLKSLAMLLVGVMMIPIAGCQGNQEEGVGEQIEETMEETGEEAGEAADEAEEGMDEATDEIEE